MRHIHTHAHTCLPAKHKLLHLWHVCARARIAPVDAVTATPHPGARPDVACDNSARPGPAWRVAAAGFLFVRGVNGFNEDAERQDKLDGYL